MATTKHANATRSAVVPVPPGVGLAHVRVPIQRITSTSEPSPMTAATAPSTSGPRCHSGLPPRSFGSLQVADVLHERLQLVVGERSVAELGHVAGPTAHRLRDLGRRRRMQRRRLAVQQRTAVTRPLVTSRALQAVQRSAFGEVSLLGIDLGNRWAAAARERDDVVDERVPDLRRVERFVTAHFGVGRRQRHAARRQVVVDETRAGTAQVRPEVGAARVRAVTRRAVAQVDLLHVRRGRAAGCAAARRPTRARRRGAQEPDRSGRDRANEQRPRQLHAAFAQIAPLAAMRRFGRAGSTPSPQIQPRLPANAHRSRVAADRAEEVSVTGPTRGRVNRSDHGAFGAGSCAAKNVATWGSNSAVN